MKKPKTYFLTLPPFRKEILLLLGLQSIHAYVRAYVPPTHAQTHTHTRLPTRLPIYADFQIYTHEHLSMRTRSASTHFLAETEQTVPQSVFSFSPFREEILRRDLNNIILTFAQLDRNESSELVLRIVWVLLPPDGYFLTSTARLMRLSKCTPELPSLVSFDRADNIYSGF